MKKWEYLQVWNVLVDDKEKAQGAIRNFLGEEYKNKKWVIKFRNHKNNKIEKYPAAQTTALFNEFGKEGWELISADSRVHSIFDPLVHEVNIEVNRIEYIFKRELEKEKKGD